LSIGALRDDQARMIRGSGVNLADYSVVPERRGYGALGLETRTRL